MSKDDHHQLPLWAFFATLFGMTVCEVGIYEYWRLTGGGLMPKYAIVLVVLCLTLPKAALVMIWFMHLKYEKPLVVTIALVPISLILIGILPNIADSVTNSKHITSEAPAITGFGRRTLLPGEHPPAKHGEKGHDDHQEHKEGEKHEKPEIKDATAGPEAKTEPAEKKPESTKPETN